MDEGSVYLFQAIVREATNSRQTNCYSHCTDQRWEKQHACVDRSTGALGEILMYQSNASSRSFSYRKHNHHPYRWHLTLNRCNHRVLPMTYIWRERNSMRNDWCRDRMDFCLHRTTCNLVDSPWSPFDLREPFSDTILKVPVKRERTVWREIPTVLHS